MNKALIGTTPMREISRFTRVMTFAPSKLQGQCAADSHSTDLSNCVMFFVAAVLYRVTSLCFLSKVKTNRRVLAFLQGIRKRSQ